MDLGGPHFERPCMTTDYRPPPDFLLATSTYVGFLGSPFVRLLSSGLLVPSIISLSTLNWYDRRVQACRHHRSSSRLLLLLASSFTLGAPGCIVQQ